jgi:hypothetical protein
VCIVWLSRPNRSASNLSGPSNWSALWLTRDRGQSKDADVRNDHVAGDRCSIKSGHYGLVDAVAGRLICPEGATLRDGCRFWPAIHHGASRISDPHVS